MRKIAICMGVNGEQRELLVEPGARLIDVLRRDLGLTGTKEGCGVGVCGACTVLVDGRAQNACLVPAASMDGHAVTTIEGLSHGRELDPLQDAFLRHHAVQCGFCSPGLIMSARALLDACPHPTEEQVREAIRGNLCRCTGYVQVLAAIREVAGLEEPAPTDDGIVRVPDDGADDAGAPAHDPLRADALPEAAAAGAGAGDPAAEAVVPEPESALAAAAGPDAPAGVVA